LAPGAVFVLVPVRQPTALGGVAERAAAATERTRRSMNPGRGRSQTLVRDARGADSMDETKQRELRVLDIVRTGGLPRVMAEGF
jgi:hypothetical protein